MKRILITIFAIFIIVTLMLAPSCRTDYSGPTESFTMAYPPFESTALFWIAENQGLFSRNGLFINLKIYDTGSGALEGMMKGEADIAIGISEFPIVGKALQKEKVCIFGNIDKAEFIYVVARKDRGIENATDLKGKRVGTTIGTIASYHLGMLLNLNGMSIKDITLVDLKTPEEWVNAVAVGDIDAVVTAQPYANYARERLGTNAVFFSAQGGQFLYGLVGSSEGWVTEHTASASRFLKSLIEAEDYLRHHPAESKAIVEKKLNFDNSYIETVWLQNRFSVSLEQSLLLSMEDEARWLISNNLTPAKTVPNLLEYIYTDALKAVKPEAVRIAGK